MVAKKNKKGKLDRAWLGYLIDFIVGPHMMMLGMREPTGAQRLQEIMVNEMNKMWAKPEYTREKTSINQFVVDAGNELTKMFNLYMTAKLCKYLEDGVPEAPRILSTGAGSKLVH